MKLRVCHLKENGGYISFQDFRLLYPNVRINHFTFQSIITCLKRHETKLENNQSDENSYSSLPMGPWNIIFKNKKGTGDIYMPNWLKVRQYQRGWQSGMTVTIVWHLACEYTLRWLLLSPLVYVLFSVYVNAALVGAVLFLSMFIHLTCCYAVCFSDWPMQSAVSCFYDQWNCLYLNTHWNFTIYRIPFWSYFTRIPFAWVIYARRVTWLVLPPFIESCRCPYNCMARWTLDTL